MNLLGRDVDSLIDVVLGAGEGLRPSNPATQANSSSMTSVSIYLGI